MSRATSFITILILAVAITGCSKKNKDFPTQIQFTTPQTVTSLSVVNPQNLDYDLDWQIGDPNAVTYYRVYASIDGSSFSLIEDMVTSPMAQYSSFVPIAAFGVTVVSDEYVEGAMVIQASPTP